MESLEEAEADLHDWAAHNGRKVPEIYIERETIERNDLTLAQILARCDIDDELVSFEINGTTASYTESFEMDTLLIHFLDDRIRQEAVMKEHYMLKKHEKDPFYIPHDLIHRPSAVHEYGLSIQEVKGSTTKVSSSCGYFKTVGKNEVKDGGNTLTHTPHVLRFKTLSNVNVSGNSSIDICSACLIHRICKKPFPFICFRPLPEAKTTTKTKQQKRNHHHHKGKKDKKP
jgi:hypothetical protein